MAKSKKKTKLSTFSRFSKPQLIVAAIFILGFGGFGVWKLAFSKAATGVNGRIAFQCSHESGPGVHICSANPDGTVKKDITPPTYGVHSDNDPTWSPDGTKIAFTRSPMNGEASSIYVVNADGTNLRKLTTPPLGSYDIYPVWSNNGSSITFNRIGRLVTVDSSTGATIRDIQPLNGLSSHSGGYASGKFSLSPDGSRVVFSNQVSGGNLQIFVANSNGSDWTASKQLTYNTGSSQLPSWSPDGTKIVYYNSGVSDLYLMNPDGTNQVRLNLPNISSNSWIYSGWSPDSKKLMFGQGYPTPFRTYTIGAINPISTAFTGYAYSAPSWGTAPIIPADSQAPVANITSPANGLKIKGTKPIIIKYSATDNTGVVKMELYIDNVLINTVSNTSSSQYSWDIKNIARGTHTISVKAYDAAGNIGNKAISVTK